MVADLIVIGLGIALQPFRVSAFILILSSKGGTARTPRRPGWPGSTRCRRGPLRW